MSLEQRVRVALVGGSPEAASTARVRAVTAASDVVVAIDRGLDALMAAGVPCDLFCGDADSVSPEGAERVRWAEAAQGKAEGDDTSFEVVRYNPHKDDTDLGLALAEVSRRWPGAVLTATCFGGGNPDHLLGVLGRFAAWQGSVQLIEDGYEGRILHAGDAWCVAGAVGSRFSFIPLTPEAIVSEYHMRWELDHKHVELLSDLGISNVIEHNDATITCHSGTLACWVFL